MSDRIFGGIGLVLAVFYIWAATIIPESFMADAIGPKTFPIIIGALLALASVVFLVSPDDDPLWPTWGNLAELGFAAVAMLLYAKLLPELGFIIATILATAYLTWRLGTAPLWSLVTGLGTSVGIYLVFHIVLGLNLAEGPLGF